MTDSFQIAIGHNNAGSLAEPTVSQPRSPGVKWPGRVRATDGTLILKGLPYCDWIWDFMSFADYADWLAECGLEADTPTPSTAVTIKTLYADFETWGNFNATVNLPTPEETVDADRGKALSIVMRFVGLEAL